MRHYNSSKATENPDKCEKFDNFHVVCACVTLNAILLKEVSTFDEYTDILFHVVSNGVFGVLYAIIVWKTLELFELIDQQAQIVRASEYRILVSTKNSF